MITRTLLIDNYDSFTYNLFDLLHGVNGAAPVVVRNDTEWSDIDLTAFDNVVISPGPGHPLRPRDFGISARVIADATLPVLGVCLGHQGLCALLGGEVGPAPQPMHGRLSTVEHDGSELFRGIPSPFAAVRYHSLVVDALPPELEPTAWTEDGRLMGVRHRDRPMWGVQFHPESISTEHGRRLLENFRDLTPTRGPEPTAAPPCDQDRHGPYVVDHRIIEREVDPRSAFDEFFGDGHHAFWLDGTARDDNDDRYTVLGNCAGPRAEFVTYDVESATVRIERPGLPIEQVHTSFFDYLDRQLTTRAVAATADIPFELGYVGYLGYELKAQTGGRRAHRSPTPDAALVFADRAIVIDHARARTFALCLSDRHGDPESRRWLDTVTTRLRALPERDTAQHAPVPLLRTAEPVGLSLRHDHDRYLGKIADAQQQIRSGESYEVCLTNMASAGHSIDAVSTFEWLRAANPVPHASLLRFGGIDVVSASPERFLRVTADRTVESKPIKGTRPRAGTPGEDEALRRELLDSEKERAENLMIVDLTRNDLSRVCVPGTVHVPFLFQVETYPAVHQLVSTVRGLLAPGSSAVAAVRAAFPGGSMTGAPKLRTMEIIDRLESGPRGVYSGAIGYFSLTGTTDLSIVIRTMVATEGTVSFGIGGAITALSDPEEEFDETMVKAASMVQALSVIADHPGEYRP
ncbi:aminodeoxychorismate synthase component I [Rhodococcus triatomae]|uniref:aminodeoxychorismate synthase n=1 Tax=Rhodococcus triatomae TaxID=300028 RepID=A0A1G8JQQ7_9NOCA|nr:aminodeoxychorismate synthase component I [Rhodococcus triatomae]QNG19671.1 aminodeoxychorismate synthase component I [Rhodococcus triatomae]QNG24414.1 aminodeoxychorismate synthase component I [Rhodococcus triatomae]SDI32880.1 para-aminobenzoate synthetase [Rhodococcus triatomae]